jgi:hypothetical protein
MEKELDNIAYRLQSGIEFVRAYGNYLKEQYEQEQPAPEPHVIVVPEPIEARLVA